MSRWPRSWSPIHNNFPGGLPGKNTGRKLWNYYVDNLDLVLPPRKKLLFDKLFELVDEGEPATVRYVTDQLMGKPVQSIKQELTGADGKDLSAGIFVSGGLKEPEEE